MVIEEPTPGLEPGTPSLRAMSGPSSESRDNGETTRERLGLRPKPRVPGILLDAARLPGLTTGVAKAWPSHDVTLDGVKRWKLGMFVAWSRGMDPNGS